MLDKSGSGDDGRPTYGKIKFLRDVFGISESGFRFYEKEGLVRSSRNTDNNYRVSTLSDGVLMCNAYSLAHYGLPMKQTKEVLLDGGVDDQIVALEKLSGSLNAQLMETAARKAHIEAELKALGEFAHDPRACSVVTDVGLCILPLHTQEIELRPGFEDSSAWWSHAPLVNAGMLVQVDDNWDTTELYHGPVADENDVVRLRFPTRHAVRFCDPSSRYLHAYITFPVEMLPSGDVFSHIRRYMKDNGLRLKERRILTRLMRYQDTEVGSIRSDEVFIPLEGTAKRS